MMYVVIGLVIVVVLIAVLVVMTVRNGLQPNRPTVPAIYLSAIAGTFAVLAIVARNWPDLGVWWIAVALLPVVWLRALARVRAHRSWPLTAFKRRDLPVDEIP